ncbi:MAG: glycoside hydrolase family 99-like domain-containing protein [Lutibacter sp.]
MKNKKARVIAFYLPQFHPIPENDEWWGKGFTEWTSVARAKPLFKGHNQPRIPGELGFYDLRMPEAREAQAKMAKEAGVEGFCYWHYWFGGNKRLLERPFNEVLESGNPDFPFCLGWANHAWYQKLWDVNGKGDKLLIDQQYLGVDDYTNHFYDVLLPAFKDKRHILVDGKPMFLIYSLKNKKEIRIIVDTWRKLAINNGLKGVYFVTVQREETKEEILDLGFDAMYRLNSYLNVHIRQNLFTKLILKLRVKLFKYPRIYSYKKMIQYMYDNQNSDNDTIPIIVPDWDHSPRSGNSGIVFTGSTPKLFAKQVRKACSFLELKEEEHKILLMVSWNEWGEGNYIEPDLKNGDAYLKALKSEIVI